MKNKIKVFLIILTVSLAHAFDAKAIPYSVQCEFGNQVVHLTFDGDDTEFLSAYVTDTAGVMDKEQCVRTDESMGSRGPFRSRFKFNDHCELRLPPNWLIRAKLFPGLTTTVRGKFILNGVLRESVCRVSLWQECH